MPRKIIGSLAAIVLFPVYALGLLAIVIIYCLRFALRKIWNCFEDFRMRIVDPGYIPEIGIGGIHARNHALHQASDAAAKNDWAKAVKAWKNASGLYSPEAMFHLGECYEKGQGVPADSGVACEWYRLALQYHYHDAEEGFARLQKYALPPSKAKHVFEEVFEHRKEE